MEGAEKGSGFTQSSFSRATRESPQGHCSRKEETFNSPPAVHFGLWIPITEWVKQKEPDPSLRTFARRKWGKSFDTHGWNLRAGYGG